MASVVAGRIRARYRWARRPTGVATGDAGELFVRTTQAFEGYPGGAAPLDELPGGGGWRSVGDIGWLDHEGYLHICDRKTDMEITGGVNVYPAEVEAVLKEMQS